MARSTGNFTQAIQYLFSRWYDPSAANNLHDINNNTPISFADSTDSTSIHALSADTDGRVRVDRETYLGARIPLTFYLNATGGMTTQRIFIADRPMVITAIEEIHSAAETATGTCTLQVTKDSGVVAPGSGTALLSSTINLKGTANTVAVGSLLPVNVATGQPNSALVLAAGDTLSVVIGGTATVTALAGVVVTVWVAPGYKEIPAIYAMKANSSLATQGFFIANRDLLITGVQAIWSTAATDAGAVTLDVTHESTTTAPGSGNSILSAAINVKTTANTVASPALTATASRLILRAGDRLSVKYTGTLTALAGVVLVVYTQALQNSTVNNGGYVGELGVNFNLNANGSLATQGFWIADRDYEVVDFGEIHSTAGTDGGAVTLDLTIDKGAVAPGSGTSCLAATVNLKGTANTASYPGVTTARRNRLVSTGDVLSVKFTGTLTSLAGVDATVSLVPR